MDVLSESRSCNPFDESAKVVVGVVVGTEVVVDVGAVTGYPA